MIFTTDNRLPELGVITRPKRQQLRQLQAKKTPCYRCGEPLRPPVTFCLDNGRPAHLDCSVTRNRELRSMGAVFAYQDAVTRGGIVPCQRLRPCRTLQRRQPLSQRA